MTERDRERDRERETEREREREVFLKWLRDYDLRNVETLPSI